MPDGILIVDDDPDSREILNWVLQAVEIPLREAHNGLEALAEMRTDPPLLTILDLTMPELDGKAVLSAMRDNPMLASIPVIVFTAAPVTPELIAQLELPAKQVQRKGSQSMTELRHIIIELLGSEVKVELE